MMREVVAMIGPYHSLEVFDKCIRWLMTVVLVNGHWMKMNKNAEILPRNRESRLILFDRDAMKLTCGARELSVRGRL